MYVARRGVHVVKFCLLPQSKLLNLFACQPLKIRFVPLLDSAFVPQMKNLEWFPSSKYQ